MLEKLFVKKQQTVETVYCDKCGADISTAHPYAVFCPHCGRQLASETMMTLFEQRHVSKAVLRKAAL